MKHDPTSLLLKVLVVFASFMICGPLGNASSAALETPAEAPSVDFVASPHQQDLSAAGALTGTAAITPVQVITSTVTRTATPAKPARATPSAKNTKTNTP